jgi:hypothetical protein
MKDPKTAPRFARRRPVRIDFAATACLVSLMRTTHVRFLAHLPEGEELTTKRAFAAFSLHGSDAFKKLKQQAHIHYKNCTNF